MIFIDKCEQLQYCPQRFFKTANTDVGDLPFVSLGAHHMVTKKAFTTKAVAKKVVFKFDPDWVKDEVPPFIRLDRAKLIKINQAKKEFAKRVTEIVKGQG